MEFLFRSNSDEPLRYYGDYRLPEGIQRRVAIDLGCNVGGFPLKFAGQFDAIYCIDASYENFLRTAANLTMKGIENAYAFNLVCSDTTGKIAKVYKHQRNGHCVSVMTERKMFTQQYSDWREEREPFHHAMTISFEGLFQFFDVEFIDFLKVDIEGAEFAFLQDKDLSRVGALGIEIHGTLGEEPRQKLMRHLAKFFDIYHTSQELPAPRHCEYTFLNKRIVQAVSPLYPGLP